MGRKSKPMAQRGIEVLSARVNSDLYRQVVTLAKRKDLNVTQVVRASIRDYLARHQDARP